MKQKAKPDFTDYGISLGVFGDNCADIIAKAHCDKKLHYIGDNNTITAASRLIPKDAIILELTGTPKANDKTIEFIRSETKSAEALIAVGSGTINDLCKYASFLDEKPYSVIATAPSMNGYVSANASISIDGYKQTLSAHAPTATICDINILSAAPKRLIQAGIGDTLCRSTVQADWLLSHLLFGTPYEPAYFEWLMDSEEALINDSSDITALIESLLLSGLTMRDCGTSAPASQGEHMIAHTMEMLHPNLPQSYHGEQIAVTSLTMARRQEHLLKQASVNIVNGDVGELPEHLQTQAQAQYSQKQLSLEAKINWAEISKIISEIILPADKLEAALKAAGCPTAPQDIGWSDTDYTKATQLAQLTRNRFTFLDIE